jgi:Rieske 2Fe-2S family protein
MEKPVSRTKDTLALLNTRKANHSLTQAFYNAPEIFETDLQQIFYKDWLFAAPACEIPKAGNYVSFQVGSYPVLIVRGADGQIRAFHNSCRHRGSRLCSAARGSAPKIVCPYHQWTYELDGKLLFARDMGSDFEVAAHGLKPVHCREVGGLVFICIAPKAPDFEELDAYARRYLAPHRLNDTKVAFESTIIENGNWKLVLENNRECYHCAGSHPSLCRTFSDSPAVTGVGLENLDAEAKGHRERCEAANLPSSFHLEPEGQWRLARVPLLGAAESFTLDGKAAVKRLLGDMPFRNAGSLLFFHFPTSWNHFLSDHAVVFRVLPKSPTETEVTTKWLVHKDAVEGVDYDLKRLTEVWMATNDEDRRVVEENQIGVNSPVYEPGPYSELHEGGVIQFIDWYCSRLSERLSDQHAALEA